MPSSMQRAARSWAAQKPVLLMLMLALGACSKPADPSTTADGPALIREAQLIRIPEASPLRQTLVVAAVESRELARELAAPGEVQSDPLRLAKVASPASGKLQQVFVTLGQSVRRGDPLFSLDSPDVDQAIADQARAGSALLLAKKNVDRQRDFLAHGIVAAQDVETAEDAYVQADAEAKRAQARLSGLGYRGDNPQDASILTIRAPADGSIVELSASPGTWLNDVATPLVTIADISQVVVRAQLPERDLGFVRAGTEALLSFVAFPDQSFSGTVGSVSDVIAADTRRAAVLIPLVNAGKQLKPGMFANVRLREPPQPRLVVPATALLQAGGDNVVYVENPAWTFTQRAVTLDYQQGDNVVIAKGLSVGERLLVKGGVLIHAQ